MTNKSESLKNIEKQEKFIPVDSINIRDNTKINIRIKSGGPKRYD